MVKLTKSTICKGMGGKLVARLAKACKKDKRVVTGKAVIESMEPSQDSVDSAAPTELDPLSDLEEPPTCAWSLPIAAVDEVAVDEVATPTTAASTFPTDAEDSLLELWDRDWEASRNDTRSAFFRLEMKLAEHKVLPLEEDCPHEYDDQVVIARSMFDPDTEFDVDNQKSLAPHEVVFDFCRILGDERQSEDIETVLHDIFSLVGPLLQHSQRSYIGICCSPASRWSHPAYGHVHVYYEMLVLFAGHARHTIYLEKVLIDRFGDLLANQVSGGGGANRKSTSTWFLYMCRRAHTF